MQHEDTAETAHAAVEVQLELREDSLAWSLHLGTEGSALVTSLLSLVSDISSIGSAVQRFDSDEGAPAGTPLPAAWLLGYIQAQKMKVRRDAQSSNAVSCASIHSKSKVMLVGISRLSFRRFWSCNTGALSSPNCVRGHQAKSSGSASQD